MIAITIEATAACLLLLGVVKDVGCTAAAELDPRTDSTVTLTGELLHWTADAGDTLELTLVAARGGTYSISVLAEHGLDAAAFSAKLWDNALTRDGAERIELTRAGERKIVAVDFDPVSLGPGRHVLELSCLEPGEIVLDCVALRRTGERDVAQTRDDSRGTPFLGIEFGGARAGGVELVDVISDTAAAKAGLVAGDVLCSIDGRKTDSPNRVSPAIRRHQPGDRVELVVLRGDQLLNMTVELGRRAESKENSSRATHVIEVLDVQPGEVIADLGCGTGWLSEAIAKAVGADGLVYAVEIDEGHIRDLRRTASLNVVPVHSVRDDVSLPENSLDTAMLHDVASHVDGSARPRFYESVVRALKPGGKLVIFGPHGKAREMLDELRQYGFLPVNDEELATMSQDDLDTRLREGITFHYRG